MWLNSRTRRNYSLIGILIITLIQLVTVESQGGEQSSKDVTFFFYPNSGDPDFRVPVQTSDFSNLTSIKLNPQAEYKFLIHGLTGSCMRSRLPKRVIPAYQQVKKSGVQDYNVVCIDYEPISFPRNANNLISVTERNKAFAFVMKYVANETMLLLQELKTRGLLPDYKKVHMIGHSLGAHVAGSIGYQVYEKSGFMTKIGRISGLDPANILLLGSIELDLQIDYGDADFVDVYHTNSGMIGLRGKYGHVDFYPDGGARQGYCVNRMGIIDQITERTGQCSHGVIGIYWAYSVLDNSAFIACKAEDYDEYLDLRGKRICNDPVNFGEATSPSVRGKYFIKMPAIPAESQN